MYIVCAYFHGINSLTKPTSNTKMMPLNTELEKDMQNELSESVLSYSCSPLGGAQI